MAWRRGTLRQQVVFWITAAMIPLGMFICVGGTYGVVVQIKEAYASGRIGELRYLLFLGTGGNILLTTFDRLCVLLRG